MTQKNTKKFKTIDLVYIGLFAALIAVCAWIAIPLTVSVTLQTLGVCLAGGLLGCRRATLATVIYVLLGIIGLPVFTGFGSGISAVSGPTGGYIIGFIFTAFIAGIGADRAGAKIWKNIVFMALGVIVCYVFGTIWFVIAYKVSFSSALATCVFPFLIPDAVKVVLAAVLTNRLKRFVK